MLLAYAKIVLFSDIVASDVPDDPHFERDLLAYFPARMEKKYAAEIAGHRLRREIIARVVANDLVNRGGPSFVSRLMDATGRGAREVVRAFTVVRDGFGLPALYAEIDALDNKIDGQVQLDLYAAVGRLVLAATAWVLKNGSDDADSASTSPRSRRRAQALEPKLASLLPDFMRGKLEERAHGCAVKAGAPEELADRLALLDIDGADPRYRDWWQGRREGRPDWRGQGLLCRHRGLPHRPHRGCRRARSHVTDYYDGLALSRAADTIGAARAGHCGRRRWPAFGKAGDPVAAWLEAGGERIGGRASGCRR